MALSDREIQELLEKAKDENTAVKTRLECYNRLIENDTQPSYFSERADTKRCLDDFTGAVNDMNRAIELDPGRGFYYRQRGVNRLEIVKTAKDISDSDRKELLERVAADYKASKERNPTDPGIWLELIAIDITTEDYDSAVAHYGESRQYIKSKEDGLFRAWLGCLSLVLGDHPDIEKDMEPLYDQTIHYGYPKFVLFEIIESIIDKILREKSGRWETVNKINTLFLEHFSNALITVSLFGSNEVVKALLANGADVNAKDKYGATALMVASEKSYLEVVKALLAKGADVNAKDNNGVTALMVASGNGHTEVVNLLLANGADVNAKDNDGLTALRMASQFGHSEVVKVLLAKGADINAKANDGVTALMVAAQNGHSEVVKSLLANGADVNAKDKYGATALMLASEIGHSEIVKFLLAEGVNVNAKDNNGVTALMLASGIGHSEIVKFLLAEGADVNAKDNNGVTALKIGRAHV